MLGKPSVMSHFMYPLKLWAFQKQILFPFNKKKNRKFLLVYSLCWLLLKLFKILPSFFSLSPLFNKEDQSSDHHLYFQHAWTHCISCNYIHLKHLPDHFSYSLTPSSFQRPGVIIACCMSDNPPITHLHSLPVLMYGPSLEMNLCHLSLHGVLWVCHHEERQG